MTAQYANRTINDNTSPTVITVPTLDVTPVLVTVAQLTQDGTAIRAAIVLFGIELGDVAGVNYLADGDAVFERTSGVVALSAAASAGPTATGPAGVVLAWTVAGDLCQLSITGTANPMRHYLSTRVNLV